MELKFVLGRSGTGKTALILNEMVKPNKHFIYIVPEQYSLQAEKDILSITNATIISVLSFKRLAYRIFSETGQKNKTILDDVALKILLRKVINIVKDRLVYYNNTKITQGFIQKLAHTINELIHEGVESNTILAYLNEGTTLGNKTKDIFTIYNEFINFTGTNYIPLEEALDILANKIKDSIFLTNSYIYIDGFNSFTKQELDILNELLKVTKGITIAITTNSNKINHSIDEVDPFFETKNTIHKLAKMANINKIPINTIYLKENLRHNYNQELKIFEDTFFDLSYKFLNSTEKITLTSCINSYKEVYECASNILQIVRDQGLTYSEIAVIAPDTYHLAIQSIFKENNVPFFLDKTIDLVSHPLVTTLISGINITINNWNKESVFSLLKAGLTNISNHDIDLIENYALAYNIKGYRWKQPKWVNLPDWLGKDREYINEIKENIVNTLTKFEMVFSENKTVKDITTNIFNVMANIGIFENLLKDEENKKKNTTVYNKLVHVLELLVEFLGEEVVSPKEYLSVLEVGLATIAIGKVPETLESVIIANFNRSRLPNIKALFVLGLNEIGYNESLSLYSDEEKFSIRSMGVNLITSYTHILQDNFTFYTYFTKPSQKLFISYSTNSLEGKTLNSTPMVSILKNKNISKKIATQNTSPKSMLKNLSIAMHNYYNTGIINNSNIELYSWYINNNYYINDIELIAKGEVKPHLSSHSVDMLYNGNINTSVSRLEKYAQCPFAYFVAYNLKAKERQIYELQNIDFGKILHVILEDFINYLKISDKNFNEISKEEIKAFIETSVNNFNTEIMYLFDSYRSKYILERLKRIATTSIWALCKHLSFGEFELYDTEIDFGKSGPLTSIIVDIDEKRKFVLKGRLDRIDIYHSNGDSYIKILDYKSSNKKFDIKDVYHGMQLQLIIYLKAILQNAKKYFNSSGKVLPGGVFYFNLDDPMINVAQDTLKTFEEELLKSFVMSGIVLKDKNIIDAIQSKSKVLPVSINKDGSIRKSDYTLSLSEFENIMEASLESLKKIGQSLLSGVIAPLPFKKGNATACDYCKFKPICKFNNKTFANNKDII